MNGIDFLADTNFLIHIHEGHPIVEPFLDYRFAISYITELELLGKFSISKTEKTILKKLIADCFIIDMNSTIKDRCIWLRQRYKIKLPDAIIAATSIETGIPLISSDQGFGQIKELNFLFLEKTQPL